MARRARVSGLLPGRLFGMMETLTRDAVRNGELGVAAASTIGHRTAMMARAFGDPVAMSNPEFTRMGTEKVEALAQSAHALHKGMNELGEAWLALLTGPAQATAMAVTGMAKVRTPFDLMTLHQRWMAHVADASLHAGMHIAESVAALGAAGMAPIHRAASANARRLGRARR